MSTPHDAMQWFKANFHNEIKQQINGTLITEDLLTAIAYLETGIEIWNRLRQKNFTIQEIAALCNGDTIDKRSAFPTSYAELDAYKVGGNNIGKKMFKIARKALGDMAHATGSAAYITEYNKPPCTEFCHGFGIFQYDIQHLKEHPNYFLNEEFKEFSKSLAKCIEVLNHKIKKMGYDSKSSLSFDELVHIAIAYNTGSYNFKKGLEQGHYNSSDKMYYGQKISKYLKIAQTIPNPTTIKIKKNEANILPPLPLTSTGAKYEVNISDKRLRLRSQPNIENKNNIIAHLPDGHIVQSFSNEEINGFLEVETYISGAYFRGYAYKQYLNKTDQSVKEPTKHKQTIPNVEMPTKSGKITQRTDPPGAYSLNESGQPNRSGNTAKGLCESLAKIVAWLNVEKYKRYKSINNGKTTYCNIYAHDYCYLAGVYLPRVWWTPKAIALLASGSQVLPKYAETIIELRANDLFQWLKDFGEDFGWQRVDTTTKLQTSVNQGAVGLIVAKRIQNQGPGHIVVVVPETNDHQANRNSKGEVTQPLQSQAGAVNFNYGIGRTNWWLNEDKFESSAFWIHK